VPKTSDRFVRLVLCKPEDDSARLEVDFRLFATDIARRWGEAIAFLDKHGAYITTPDRFYNFANDPKSDPDWLRRELERCITGINRLVPGFVRMKLGQTLTQETMNELHEYFVDGSGQLENRRALDAVISGERLGALRPFIADRDKWQLFLDAFKRHAGADAEQLNFVRVIEDLDGHAEFGRVLMAMHEALSPTRRYLIQLNQAIHRWEDQCAVQAFEDAGGERWQWFVINFFPSVPLRLNDDDYQQFTIRDVFGRVYLDDISVGKCIWAVFKDRDQQIAGDHYKNLHTFWGDARFYFGSTQSEEFTAARMAEFWRWFDENQGFLKQVGFRRGDPKMTVGRLPVADLERRGALAGTSEREIVHLLGQYQFVKRALLVDAAGEELGAEGRPAASWAKMLIDAPTLSGPGKPRQPEPHQTEQSRSLG